MHHSETEGDPRYRTLRAEGIAALDAGRLEAAFDAFAGALEAARALGDEELVERAFCNRAAVLIAMGELDAPIGELRRILMAHRSSENAYLAAYHISRSFELRKEHKKGLFYARLAFDQAERLQRVEWLASSHNKIANLLVAESQFGAAADEYRAALRLLTADDPSRRLTFEVNLGYCELMLEHLATGLSLLYRGLRQARSAGLQRLEMIAHLDICFAHLETGRLRYAAVHGLRGLAMAEASGEADQIKNALFLVGELSALLGDGDQAHRYFSSLQQRFYPDQPFIADFLLSVDVRKMVNLRA